jgi:hypothetical protein
MRTLMVLGLVALSAMAVARPAAAQWSQSERAGSAPAGTTASASTKSLRYELGQPVPPGYHVVEHRATALATVGGIVFGVGYGSTALGAVGASLLATELDDHSRHYELMVVPGVGPFTYMIADHRFNEALAVLGGVQLAGIGLAVLGLTLPPTRTLARDSFALRAATPVALPGGGGLAFGGTF